MNKTVAFQCNFTDTGITIVFAPLIKLFTIYGERFAVTRHMVADGPTKSDIRFLTRYYSCTHLRTGSGLKNRDMAGRVSVAICRAKRVIKDVGRDRFLKAIKKTEKIAPKDIAEKIKEHNLKLKK